MVGGKSLLPTALTQVLAGLPRLAVAFSGGLDSRFLCHAAMLCGCDVLAVHARGPHIPARESDDAAAWAAQAGLPLVCVDFDPLPLLQVAQGSRERCYACKVGLVAAMRGLPQLADGRVLCDGSNADDGKKFRPGLRAIREAGVRSPLAEAGLDKAAIRALAAATGMDRPDQMARPCLLTRLDYGLAPNAALLARLDRAESALAGLTDGDGAPALGDFRLRILADNAPSLLQVTGWDEGLRQQVEHILASEGFAPCEIRLEQTVSGFFDSAGR